MLNHLNPQHKSETLAHTKDSKSNPPWNQAQCMPSSPFPFFSHNRTNIHLTQNITPKPPTNPQLQTQNLLYHPYPYSPPKLHFIPQNHLPTPPLLYLRHRAKSRLPHLVARDRNTEDTRVNVPWYYHITLFFPSLCLSFLDLWEKKGCWERWARSVLRW